MDQPLTFDEIRNKDYVFPKNDDDDWIMVGKILAYHGPEFLNMSPEPAPPDPARQLHWFLCFLGYFYFLSSIFYCIKEYLKKSLNVISAVSLMISSFISYFVKQHFLRTFLIVIKFMCVWD